MDQNPLVLLSSARSGSAWVERYIKAVNYKNGYHEIFNSTFFDLAESREEFLNRYLDLKIFINEGTYPHFRLHPTKRIRETDEIFYDIIKDYNIVMLSRKDRWRAVLSCLIQHQTGWMFAHHFTKDQKVKWNRQMSNGIFIQKKNLHLIEHQLQQHEYLETVKHRSYKFLYYEDLSDKELRKHFPIELTEEEKQKYEKYLLPPFSDKDLNYEDYIKNIDEVKEAYEYFLG